MNKYDLSREELDIVQYLEEERNIAIIQSEEDLNTRYFIRTFLIHTLLKAESVIIRTSDVQMIESIKLYFGGLGINSILLNLDKASQNIVNSEDLGFDNSVQIEAVKNGISYRQKLSEIQSIVEDYKMPVFGSFPRIKLAELYRIISSNDSENVYPLHLKSNKFIYSHDEFWLLKNKVEKASKFYKTKYHYSKSGDQFSSSIYKDFHVKQNQTAIFNYLIKFKEDCKLIIDKYESTFEKIYQALLNDYSEHLKNIQQYLENLDYQIQAYDLCLNLFSKNKAELETTKHELRAAYNLVIENLEKKGLFKIKTPINSWNPEVSVLHAFCDKLRSILKSSYNIITAKIQEQVEIISITNKNYPEIENIFELQNDLCYSINGSKLFKEEIQNLGISAVQNLKYLKDLYLKILDGIQFLNENQDYGIWRSFENTLDGKGEELLNALLHLPQNKWTESFELWYFESLFKKHNTFDSSSFLEKTDAFLELKHIDKNFEGFRIFQALDNKIYTLEKEHKSAANNLKKRIKKEKINTTNLRSIYNICPSLFKCLFPVIIIPENAESNLISDLEYEHLVCFENNDFPVQLFANSHFNSASIYKKKGLTESEQSLIYSAKNYLKKKKFTLHSKRFFTSFIDKIRLKEKIRVSKKLVKILKLISNPIHCYSAKNYSIISCLMPYWNAAFEEEIEDLSIKKMKFDEIGAGIVEDLILKEDNYKILLIQDQFLDPDLELEWQLATIRGIEQIGIKIIRIDSFKLASDSNFKVLDQIDISEIKLEIQHEKDIQESIIK